MASLPPSPPLLSRQELSEEGRRLLHLSLSEQVDGHERSGVAQAHGHARAQAQACADANAVARVSMTNYSGGTTGDGACEAQGSCYDAPPPTEARAEGVPHAQRPTEALMRRTEAGGALLHRHRQRHMLVIAPTDHGTDSLLGYLAKHRSWPGQALKRTNLAPHTTERHQHPWLSQPLCYDGHPGSGEDGPIMITLLVPLLHDEAALARAMAIADGVLAVVDASVELNAPIMTPFREAARRCSRARLSPVLFLNKVDKLQSLEPDDELCYQRISSIIDDFNAALKQGTEGGAGVSGGADDVGDGGGGAGSGVAPRVSPMEGTVVFGRGSLSIAESIGGWGFTLESWHTEQARLRRW